MKTSRRHRNILIVLGTAFVLIAAFVAGRASAAQPHMRNALDHLIAAKSELQVAAHDKAGHRVKALGFVNDAIAQVREGIAAGAE
jgi:hypothetical protein